MKVRKSMRRFFSMAVMFMMAVMLFSPVVSKAATKVTAPAKTTVTAKRSGKYITATAKKSKGATGYQFQRATASNFKNATTKTQTSVSYKFQASTSTTYYVRVRAYTKVKSTTKYSSWSTAVKVNKTSSEVTGKTVKEVYTKVLKNIKTYKFSKVADAKIEGYEYFVRDLDGDGIKELIVSAKVIERVFIVGDCRIFTCKKDGNGYKLSKISGEAVSFNITIPSSGKGLYSIADFSRRDGKTTITRLTISSGKLVQKEVTTYTMGSKAEKNFLKKTKEVTWTKSTSTKGLSSLK